MVDEDYQWGGLPMGMRSSIVGAAAASLAACGSFISAQPAMCEDVPVLAGPAPGQPDEDHWRNPVAPTAAALFRRLPYLPDPEEIPAGALVGPAAAHPDEDYNARALFFRPTLLQTCQVLPYGSLAAAVADSEAHIFERGQHGVSIEFLDQNANVLALYRNAQASSDWVLSQLNAIAPAGAVSVRLSLWEDAQVEAQFDSVYARRSFDGGLVNAGSVGNAGLTYANFDNLWPNGTSEKSPTFGVTVLNDDTQPEWDFRARLDTTTTQSGTLSGIGQTINVGDTSSFPASGTVKIQTTVPSWVDMAYTGKTPTSFMGCTGSGSFANGARVSDAYAGSWVRSLQSLGGAGQDVSLDMILPCGVGDAFLFQAQTKSPSASGVSILYIQFRDADNNVLSTVNTFSITPPSWTALSLRSAPAPAGTALVQFRLTAGTISGSYTGLFDQILVAKLISGACLGGDASGRVDLSGALSQARYDSNETGGAGVSIDASVGNEFAVSVTDGTAFSVGAPTKMGTGQRITVRIRNTSGGALGAVTWNAVFKMAAWTSPANGFSRAIDFSYNGANWIEVGRTTVDVPN